MAKTTPTVSLEGRDGSSTTDASTNLYGSRGSGRRHRHKFDPYKWTSSIPPRKTNVLCLGVSYPSVEAQLKRQKISKRLQLFHPKPCVEQAVELVRRNILTEMDGRDLARCFSLESTNQTNAYCVSLERGAIYLPSRHLSANFNRKGFTKECKQAFGKSIKFRQIILDYFWIPKGSWAMTHWQPEFFQFVLPSFIKDNLLEMTSIRSFLDVPRGDHNIASADTFSSLQEGGASGVVYLPFTLYCVSRIIAAYKELSECYSISFMSKSELSEHALWYATSQINPDAMQSWLGKAINQEDVYCTFLCSEVMQTSYNDVTKEEILNVLKRIQSFDNVRMIRLQALRSGEKGGFVGMLNIDKQKQTQTDVKQTVGHATRREKKKSCIPNKARMKQTFFNKLMKLIKEGSKDFNDVVSWNDQGTHFSINVEEAFEHNVLQQNFHGITFKEFEKRLISCGFTKSENGFSHKSFCRYKPERTDEIIQENSKESFESVRLISHGSKPNIWSENKKETDGGRNSSPSFLEGKSISTLDETSMDCDQSVVSIRNRDSSGSDLSLRRDSQNQPLTTSIYGERSKCAINSNFECTKNGANAEANDLKTGKACKKRSFICTETATLPCVYASNDLSKPVHEVKQQRTSQDDSCTARLLEETNEKHAARLIEQRRAECPAVGFTSSLPHLKDSNGSCHKERFSECDKNVPTITKRIRADAGPDEISSDMPFPKLVNRSVPENSLLQYYGDMNSIATCVSARKFLSQAWDSTARVLPNQHVNVTSGGSADTVIRNSPILKLPQTQKMRSSPLISAMPLRAIEPTSYLHHPCLSQHTSHPTNYPNHPSFCGRDGDGTGLAPYVPRVTRMVKGSPITHQLNTCMPSKSVRNSSSTAGSKNDLKDWRLLLEWEIVGDIFKDFESSRTSVSSNTGFGSADIDSIILSYAARALLLLKTC